MIRVAIVDDHAVFRLGLKTAMVTDDIQIVLELGEADQLLHNLAKSNPDVLCLDLQMKNKDGGRFNPAKTITEINRINPDVRILIISGHLNISMIRSLFDSQVRGYLLKEELNSIDVSDAVRAIFLGKVVISPKVSNVLLKYRNREISEPSFTKRQLDVLLHLASNLDKTSDQIGADLGLTGQSVRNYLNTIYKELEVTNGISCVVRAIELGVIPAPSLS